MKSLFVGNLAWATTDEDLKTKFSEFGNVISARIVNDKFTGKSRGFGFVEMEDSDAEKAIAALNGTKWGERDLTVNEARPKSDNRGGDRRGGGGGNGGGGRRSFNRF